MLVAIARYISPFAGFVLPRQSGDGGSGSSGGEQAARQASGLSSGDWIKAGIILGSAIVLALVVAYVVRKLVARRNEMLASLAGRVFASIVVVIGLVYSLNAVGVAVAPLVGGLGIGGLAVGFALKDILKNLLAGVMIQLRQPFQVGDLVELDGYFGKIEKVTLRTVDMETVDGEYVLIPAATVIENAIVNWSTLGRRRAQVLVGVGYEADPRAAAQGIQDAVSALDVVLDDKAVKVVITELSDSYVTLRVLAWHDVSDHFLDVTHEIAATAKQWCEDNDVSMPAAVREVTITNIDDVVSAMSERASAGSASAER